jgi:hypothetical protein
MALSGLKLMVINGVQIPITSGSYDDNVTTERLGTTSTPFSTLSYITERSSTVSFTSNAIKTCLTNLPLYGKVFDSTSTVDLYFCDKLRAGTGTGNTNYYQAVGTKLSILGGMIHPTSISAPGSGSASISYQIYAANNGASAVIQTDDSTSPSITSYSSEAFKLGPVQDSTGETILLSSFTINFAVTEQYERYSSIDPLSVAVNNNAITIQAATESIAEYKKLYDGNIGGKCISDLDFFLRRQGKCSDTYADVDAEHIKFSVATGFSKGAGIPFDTGSAITYSVDIDVDMEADGLSFPVVADLASAIA